MSDLKKYEGVIPAFYACYDDQGEVSPERTRALVQYFFQNQLAVLYALVDTFTRGTIDIETLNSLIDEVLKWLSHP